MGARAKRRSVEQCTLRAEDFGVRRWLQLGAASAGVSAALLGLSPLVAVAAADGTGDSSTAGANTSASAKSDTDTKKDAKKDTDAKDTGAKDAKDTGAKDTKDTKDTAAKDATKDHETDVKDSAGDASPTKVIETVADPVEMITKTDPVATPVVDEPAAAVVRVDHPAEAATKTGSDATLSTVDVVVAAVPATSHTSPVTVASGSVPVAAEKNAATALAVTVAATPAATVAQLVPAAPVVPATSQQMVVATDPISVITSWVQNLIGSLPIPAEFKDLFTGALWTVRRSLFNEAPVVAPVQVSGRLTGPIVGNVDAYDPEGDPIVYSLVRGPALGTVQIDSAGNYTYTPGVNFTGVDSFVVAAADTGLHINLLDPLRFGTTQAGTVVNQGAIKFAFTYTTGSDYWSTDARNALQAVANSVAEYFTVPSPVVVSYDVTGDDSTVTGILASAGSNLVGSGPGFFRTVVQNKLLSGVDSNGAAADGEINWNFAYAWAYGDSVAAGQFDFTSTVLHELMHSFGFLSYTEPAGSNTGQSWTLFDSLVVNSAGTKVIGPDFRWNTAYDTNLTGGNGGLFLGGVNAVAAYGALVPIFTPNPWEPGSSTSHLDDATFTGANQQLMNAKTDTGLGVRVLSPIELGILTDLGYTVTAPQPSTYGLMVIGFVFVRRIRKNSTSAAA